MSKPGWLLNWEQAVREARGARSEGSVPNTTVRVEAQTLIEIAARLRAVEEAVYIEDCHVTGTHDPTHTPHYICDRQFRIIGMAVCHALLGVEWQDGGRLTAKEANKIPRRLNREPFSWYLYFRDHGMEDAAELERWEKDGFVDNFD